MVIDWLKKPFPFIESLRDKLLISLCGGLVVVIFLVIFQPFGIDSVHEGIYLYLSGFGLIVIVVIAFNIILLPLLLPRYINHDKWTIGKNILFILWVLIIISLFNYVYGQYLVNQDYIEALEQSNRTGILSWIFMTFSVGIFPVFFYVFFAERQLLKWNQRIAGEINKDLHKSVASHDGIKIEIESGKNKFLEINSSKLICVRAEGGNYSTVYWQEEEGSDTQMELLRLTLHNFLEKAKYGKNIVRCHKSYVVNLEKVDTVRGNARSLLLELKGLDFEIPVSRSFPREKLAEIA